MAKSNKTTKTKLPDTYEAALDELQNLIQMLEEGQVPLDDLLVGYQRGAALLNFCKEKLTAVEGQIKVLDDEIVDTQAQNLEDGSA